MHSILDDVDTVPDSCLPTDDHEARLLLPLLAALADFHAIRLIGGDLDALEPWVCAWGTATEHGAVPLFEPVHFDPDDDDSIWPGLRG